MEIVEVVLEHASLKDEAMRNGVLLCALRIIVGELNDVVIGKKRRGANYKTK